jgi:hypothetical protein
MFMQAGCAMVGTWARYYFSDAIAGYAEVGYGITPVMLGLTLKF